MERNTMLVSILVFILGHRWMAEFNRDTVCELLPPHLCIYLSAPIEVIRERIIKRNDVRLTLCQLLLCVLSEFKNNLLSMKSASQNFE